MWLLSGVEYLKIHHAIEYKKTFIGKNEIFQVFVEFLFILEFHFFQPHI